MSDVIEVGVPGMNRGTINLHELPTKKGGTWFCLARMKDGQKVGISKGALFAADNPADLPDEYTINGEVCEAKVGATRNGGTKTYVSHVTTLSDGRKVRVLVQASVNADGYWIYANGHPSKGGVTEDDVL